MGSRTRPQEWGYRGGWGIREETPGKTLPHQHPQQLRRGCRQQVGSHHRQVGQQPRAGEYTQACPVGECHGQNTDKGE